MRKFHPQKITLLASLVIICFIWLGFTLASPTLPSQKEPIILYSNQTQDDLHLVFNKTIGQAQKSILLMIYSLKDTSIINALKKQSEKGVDVRVICDSKASGHVERKLGNKIKTTRLLTKAIMHLKILIIDGKLVWIGSANMTRDSLRMHSNLVAGIYSRALAQTIERKASALSFEGLIEPIPATNHSIGDQNLELWFLPDNSNGVDKITNLIQTAQKSVRVAMFTFTRQDFAQALANKPFQTEVVIDNNSGKGVSKYVVNLLKNSNTFIGLANKAPMFHHKFMWIDDSTLVLGSANWTKAAFSQNEDCFLILHNLNSKQQKKLHKLWNIIKAECVYK